MAIGCMCKCCSEKNCLGVGGPMAGNFSVPSVWNAVSAVLLHNSPVLPHLMLPTAIQCLRQ
eukprot:1152295-Pelagomonas_calceolata.AAC.1